jgi:hypothetical protein
MRRWWSAGEPSLQSPLAAAVLRRRPAGRPRSLPRHRRRRARRGVLRVPRLPPQSGERPRRPRSQRVHGVLRVPAVRPAVARRPGPRADAPDAARPALGAVGPDVPAAVGRIHRFSRRIPAVDLGSAPNGGFQRGPPCGCAADRRCDAPAGRCRWLVRPRPGELALRAPAPRFSGATGGGPPGAPITGWARNARITCMSRPGRPSGVPGHARPAHPDTLAPHTLPNPPRQASGPRRAPRAARHARQGFIHPDPTHSLTELQAQPGSGDAGARRQGARPFGPASGPP